MIEMNKNCARLGLKGSFFDTPHGLMNLASKSTAFDVAKLAAKCLKDARFRQVCNTKLFKVLKSQRKDNSKHYRWENTHRLLGVKGHTAIKTGVT